MKKTLVVLVAALASGAALNAGDDFSTPRAKGNEIRMSKGITTNVLVRGGVVGGARAKQLNQDLRTATVSNPDNLNRRAVARSGRFLEQQTPGVKEVQVAPAK